MRSSDMRIPIATKVAVSEVIDKYKQEIGLGD